MSQYSTIRNLHYSLGKAFDLSSLAKDLKDNDTYDNNGIVVISAKELLIGNVCSEERQYLYHASHGGIATQTRMRQPIAGTLQNEWNFCKNNETNKGECM
eukprot:1010784_1